TNSPSRKMARPARWCRAGRVVPGVGRASDNVLVVLRLGLGLGLGLLRLGLGLGLGLRLLLGGGRLGGLGGLLRGLGGLALLAGCAAARAVAEALRAATALRRGQRLAAVLALAGRGGGDGLGGVR